MAQNKVLNVQKFGPKGRQLTKRSAHSRMYADPQEIQGESGSRIRLGAKLGNVMNTMQAISEDAKLRHLPVTSADNELLTSCAAQTVTPVGRKT